MINNTMPPSGSPSLFGITGVVRRSVVTVLYVFAELSQTRIIASNISRGPDAEKLQYKHVAGGSRSPQPHQRSSGPRKSNYSPISTISKI